MKESDTSLAHIEKRLKRGLPLEFFFTIAKVFNPNSYTELSHRTMKNVVSYFISILFLSYAIMIIVSLPVLVTFESQLGKELSKFDELIVDLNISMSEPIYIKQLKLGIDATGDKNLTNENILITRNYIQTRPFICFFKPACLFRSNNIQKISLDEYRNLLEKKQEFIAWLFFLTLFFLPWILISLFVALLLKYLLVALAFTLFGFALLRIINRRIKINRIFKIGVYSLTPMVLVNTINIPLGFELLYIPFFVSLTYFIIGLILSSERGFKK